MIVDAGIGCPSQANEAAEMADAVLVNTALASSRNPEMMAEAFKNGVVSGRMAYMAGLGSIPYSSSNFTINEISGLIHYMSSGSYLELFSSTDWGHISKLIEKAMF